MPGASRSIVISASADRVFDVISAYQTYPEFMSEVKEIKISNRKDNQVDVHYKVDLVKSIKYSLRMTEERPAKLSWSFIEGEFMKALLIAHPNRPRQMGHCHVHIPARHLPYPRYKPSAVRSGTQAIDKPLVDCD